MGSAVLGDLVLGDAVLGEVDGEGAAWEATVSLVLSVGGNLTASARLEAGVAMTVTLSGALTTDILLVATIPMTLTLAGPLLVARFAGRLHTCGEPLTTARQEWLLEE